MTNPKFEYVGKFGKWEFHRHENTIYFKNLIVGRIQTDDPVEIKLILEKWFNEKLANYNNQIAKVENLKLDVYAALTEMGSLYNISKDNK